MEPFFQKMRGITWYRLLQNKENVVPYRILNAFNDISLANNA